MFHKRKKAKEELKAQALIMSIEDSKQKLLRNLAERADVHAKDRDVHDLILSLCEDINNFPQCADPYAIEIDDDILYMVDVLLRYRFYIDEINSEDGAIAKQINTVKQNANKEMCDEFEAYMKAQLKARKKLTDVFEKPQDEIDKMADTLRATFLCNKISRECDHEARMVKKIISSHLIRIANINCQIECNYYNTKELDGRPQDDETTRTLGLLKSELASLEKEQEDCKNEIVKNQELHDLIELEHIRKVIYTNKKELRMMEMVSRLSTEYEVSEIKAEQKAAGNEKENNESGEQENIFKPE